MERSKIFKLIESERAYQDAKWGREFDDKNTPNDWCTYIVKYLGLGTSTTPGSWNEDKFRENMLKVATLAVAVLERKQFAPRHYDGGK